MATDWYIKTADGERGPLTFAAVAEEMASGRVRHDDLIRSSVESLWRPTEDVPGLHRMALKFAQQTAVEISESKTIKQHDCQPAAKAGSDARPDPEHPEQSAAEMPVFITKPESNAVSAERHSPNLSVFSASKIVITLALIGTAGWFIRDEFAQQRRFPVPARLQPDHGGFRLPLLGAVSRFELALLVMDAAIISALLVIWIRSKWRHK